MLKNMIACASIIVGSVAWASDAGVRDAGLCGIEPIPMPADCALCICHNENVVCMNMSWAPAPWTPEPKPMVHREGMAWADDVFFLESLGASLARGEIERQQAFDGPAVLARVAKRLESTLSASGKTKLEGLRKSDAGVGTP